MSRRRAAPPHMDNKTDCFHHVGRGLAPAAQHGTYSHWCVGGRYPVRRWWMVHAVHPAGAAARTMALGRGLRHLRMALWDAWGFRAVRGAGISLAAASDQRLCLWKPRFFEKNRVKLFNFGLLRALRCKKTGHAANHYSAPGGGITKIIDEWPYRFYRRCRPVPYPAG